MKKFVNEKKLNILISAFISLLLIVSLLSGCESNDDGFGDSNSGDYPVVLLHGFLGWGRDEMGGNQGHFHMGGYHDIQELIKASGSECYTAVVGPFSSNWDRACELYAQLKGTRVDYGLAHSKKHGHARYGKDWSNEPLIENWGESGNNQKVNIIGHSYGGQTARTLAQLLATGYEEEINATELYEEFADDPEFGGPISKLFDGTESKNLIYSITTVSATHNGTTLANCLKLTGLVDVVGFLIASIGSIENELYLRVYDFKLEQFGVFNDRRANESFAEYFARMSAIVRDVVTNSRDTVVWDISPEGAREINEWVRAQPNIYYFSFATSVTHRAPLANPLLNWEHAQLPDSNANIISQFEAAILMGRYTCNDERYRFSLFSAQNHDGGFFMGMPLEDRPNIDSTWWDNDGTVNTISMKGPWLYPVGHPNEDMDEIVDWDKTIEPGKGVWNYWGVYTNVDHWDGQGLEIIKSIDTNNYNNPAFSGPSLDDLPGVEPDDWANPEAWYVDWARYLKTL